MDGKGKRKRILMTKTLYLVPNFLHPLSDKEEIPNSTFEKIVDLENWIGESEKAVRAFYKKVGGTLPQTALNIRILNEHSTSEDLKELYIWLEDKQVCGLISDAGYPAIADPGSNLVRYCHHKGIKVNPLPGSSSFFLALAASGLCGQSFTFHGYLPKDPRHRQSLIKRMIKTSSEVQHAHLLMETPYRNQSLFEFLLKHLPSNWYLGFAMRLGPDPIIQCHPIQAWTLKKVEFPKEPTVFFCGN